MSIRLAICDSCRESCTGLSAHLSFCLVDKPALQVHHCEATVNAIQCIHFKGLAQQFARRIRCCDCNVLGAFCGNCYFAASRVQIHLRKWPLVRHASLFYTSNGWLSAYSAAVPAVEVCQAQNGNIESFQRSKAWRTETLCKGAVPSHDESLYQRDFLRGEDFVVISHEIYRWSLNTASPPCSRLTLELLLAESLTR